MSVTYIMMYQKELFHQVNFQTHLLSWKQPKKVDVETFCLSVYVHVNVEKNEMCN